MPAPHDSLTVFFLIALAVVLITLIILSVALVVLLVVFTIALHKNTSFRTGGVQNIV